jgi:hypothetical protein
VSEREQVALAQERLPARAKDALLVDRLQRREEALERGRVTAGEPRYLLRHAAPPQHVERAGLARPANAVVRIQRAQRQLAMEVQRARGERLVQDPRHRDQRRTGVPCEAAVAQLIGASTGPVSTLDDDHGVAGGLKAQRHRESAEPGADHHDPHRR